MNKNMKITARNDYAFKTLFSRYDNKNILIEFVSLVTGIKAEDFEEIKLQDKELKQTYYNDKFGIVDIKARLKDGTKINIEMQNRYAEYYPKRNIYYWAKIYTEDIKQSELYKNLTKTISITLLNEEFPKTKKLHSIYKIYEQEEHSLLDDVLEIHYLDMTKVRTKEGKNIEKLIDENIDNIEKIDIKNLSQLEKWLLFLQTNKQEVREMLSNESQALKEATTVMKKFYSDDIEKEMYFTAEKYEMDKYNIKEEGRKEGIEEGRKKGIEEGIEKGIEKGRKKGIEEGRKEGIEEGRKEVLRENVQKMKKANLDIKLIQSITGLSEEEIMSLD